MTKKILTLLAVVAMVLSLAACSSSTASTDTASTDTASNYPDTITLVWYPNESADTYSANRDEVARIIEEATGKKVEQKLTTDYTIAIQALANGTAQMGCCWGAVGYIQAQELSSDVHVIFTNSGSSGTLDDAKYTSFFAVKTEDADQYASGDTYTIDNIEGKVMSFVSESSTSGFKVPTSSIVEKWGNGLTADDLMEGGADKFFSEVMYGGSHQGSAYNLLSGNCEVAAFCDSELIHYSKLVSGNESEVGAVYEIIENAEAPFDTMVGRQYTVIGATPVLNGPWVANTAYISPEDLAAIVAAFTSAEAANNEYLFSTDGSGISGIYKKKGDSCFLAVEDAWYDPLRK
ncbi:MAG: PhnD/SsuA/transferrin family substrate-binding protein [Erysipelotrichaceae bacterium]|nr:PhnD/SsuA/transferrin family substrate-binding protein [Erysipelotrichaceae bacterium]